MSKIDRLDFSKPPPGYVVEPYEDNGIDLWRARCSCAYLDGKTGEVEAIAASWAHHKARRNPPGMRVVWVPDDRCYPDHAGEWHIEVVTGGPALTAEFFVGDLHDSAGETKARAAAWAHYVDAVEVADLLDGENGPSETWPDRCAWPRPLAWSVEQRAEVRCWLVDSNVKLPEVLRVR